MAQQAAWVAPWDAPEAETDWGPPWEPHKETARASERRAQAGLLREVIGNPFRPPPDVDRTWSGSVRRLAEAAEVERAGPGETLEADRLAVLADALEEAGADAELLAHLRGSGPHYHGCRVVDLLLSRE